MVVVGVGGIGFDVIELLVIDFLFIFNFKEWKVEWGVVDL